MLRRERWCWRWDSRRPEPQPIERMRFEVVGCAMRRREMWLVRLVRRGGVRVRQLPEGVVVEVAGRAGGVGVLVIGTVRGGSVSGR